MKSVYQLSCVILSVSPKSSDEIPLKRVNLKKSSDRREFCKLSEPVRC